MKRWTPRMQYSRRELGRDPPQPNNSVAQIGLRAYQETQSEGSAMFASTTSVVFRTSTTDGAAGHSAFAVPQFKIFQALNLMMRWRLCPYRLAAADKSLGGARFQRAAGNGQMELA